MGNTGSFTAKVNMRECLLIFTKYDIDHVSNIIVRGNQLFPDQYTLSAKQFRDLLGQDNITMSLSDDIFNTVFCKTSSRTNSSSNSNNLHKDKDTNSLKDFGLKEIHVNDKPKASIADKYEVLCAIILLSNMNDHQKVEFLFDLFDFNKKGYLLQEEILLLILSTSYGIYMVDNTLFTPTQHLCDIIVKYVMSKYSELLSTRTAKVHGVKRRNLSTFVTETMLIRSLLQTFHGHSSQVIIATNEIWHDDIFPASYDSIYPSSSSSISISMPPGDFIQWIRHHVGSHNKTGMKLFSHTTKLIRGVDRVIVYQGPGILGKGSIRSISILANKWLQNAIILLSSKPSAFTKLFQLTNQESYGRYCCQLFEGLSWRLIYCDNRIPCGIDGEPLFMASADHHEICLMILEKAIAKYFGSYSHIATGCVRPDASYMSIRLLTGGHVIHQTTSSYEWSSGFVLSSSRNGLAYIQHELSKGSIIGFIRSEMMLTHPSSLCHPPSQRFPCGFIYPLLGVIEAAEKQYLVFKDPWMKAEQPSSSTASSSHRDADMIFGHVNTFRILVEDIPSYFDMMVMSKYPDISRSMAATHAWHSQCIKHVTHSPSQPAIFLINISHNTSTSLSVAVDDDASIIASLTGQSISHTHDHDIDADTKAMEIAFTVSSSIPWIVSGDPIYHAKTRLVLIPSYETRLALQHLSSDMMKQQSLDDSFELVCVVDGSWTTFTADLYPGSYYLFADISFNISYDRLSRFCSPHSHVRGHYPWLPQYVDDSEDQSDKHASRIILQASSYAPFSVNKVSNDDIPEHNVNLSAVDGVNHTCGSITRLINEDQSESNSSGVINMMYNLYKQQQMVRIEIGRLQQQMASMPVPPASSAPAAEHDDRVDVDLITKVPESASIPVRPTANSMVA